MKQVHLLTSFQFNGYMEWSHLVPKEEEEALRGRDFHSLEEEEGSHWNSPSASSGQD